MSDMGDGWCVECGDWFHLDDCGGYNPPCHHCGLCRSCCECDRVEDEYGKSEEDDGLDYDEREALRSRPSVGGPPEAGPR